MPTIACLHNLEVAFLGHAGEAIGGFARALAANAQRAAA
jgi:hypothetical protein